MPRRYLFGPVTQAFAEQNLQRQRARGDCLAFAATGDLDVVLDSADSWETLCARLPGGWQPDFVVLYLAYTTIPPCLWTAPLPLVGLAADWNLLWTHYRRRLRSCDLILTDSAGVDAFRREGMLAVQPATLFGCERDFLDDARLRPERDIDILFIGNIHPAVQRERLAWLARLARLGERWRVAIRTGVHGAAYRELLGRARIVFNRSIRGECNRRVFEAASAGALLFQEAENQEVPAYFRDGQECVYYTDETLETLLDYYLGHEEERQRIAEAARARVAGCSFESLWDRILEQIDQRWPELVEHASRRPILSDREAMVVRCQQALASSEAVDTTLAQDLASALSQSPSDSALRNALALVTAVGHGRSKGTGRTMAAEAVVSFRQAVELDPTNPVAGLNLAEALAAAGDPAAAKAQGARTLAELDRLPAQTDASWLDAGHFPPSFDLFRVEWERAGWTHAGQPSAEARAKHGLLRWRLHALLGELTGELVSPGQDRSSRGTALPSRPDGSGEPSYQSYFLGRVIHWYEAVLARPDLPSARAGLGQALLGAGRVAEAAAHLRVALSANPFDTETAQALFEALGKAGAVEDQRQLAKDRALLAKAAPQLVPPPAWSLDTRATGHELASILILCCNELACTRLCLPSVLRFTRQPYELVLVDNGSSDGTAAYLEEMRARPGPARVEVIRNDTNRGFPAGCNQALAKARGRYLVLLNNDTVVTPGWLEGLIAWSLHDWPAVGLVGPMSNYAPPPQQVVAAYRSAEELEAFAARRAREFARKAVHVERLTGFCLLVRREVLERVGGFDERFGPGFFDDDDLCIRAREAGFRLLLALNVYIHHFGSRTFQALGIDCAEQLKTNFDLFKAKWGDERAAGYRFLSKPTAAPLWETVASAAGLAENGSRVADPEAAAAVCPRVSLCLIVRNEEANLAACLGSVADLVDEIVVVDTGSTDRTKEIAAGFGARVVDFPWVDSFAAARNESLRQARGRWILWLDADDRMDEENRQKLKALLAGLPEELVAYVMKCLCLPDPVTGNATVVDHVRLFPNHPQIRWKYRVHEQILPAIRRLNAKVEWSDVVIHHTGYQQPALRRSKLERDLRLLRLEDAEHPDDPFTLFNLGSIYQDLRRPAEALPFFERSLARSASSDSIVRKLYSSCVQCNRQLRHNQQALALCRAGRAHYPEDSELLFIESMLLKEQGDKAGAEELLLRLLDGKEGAHFASVDAGLRGYKARHNLAVLYYEQGRRAEAEAQWRAAVAERSDFCPAWLGLGNLMLEGERWEELEKAATRLEANPPDRIEGSVLRARGCLARKEFAQARAILEETIRSAPQAIFPRVVLSHVLLQEERDWEAAEQALREVLLLDPEHGEARRNLEVLKRRLARSRGQAGGFGSL